MSTRRQIEQLFNMAIARYGAMIRRVCMSYSTPRANVDDLYQEVMVALWRGLNSFRNEATLSTWIYRIAINSCISFLRRTDSSTLYSELGYEPDAEDEAPAFGEDERAYLQYLVSRLNPIDKAIILMWLDERSYTEIADVTGLNTNVVGTRLSRIRSRMQKAWQNTQNSKPKS